MNDSVVKQLNVWVADNYGSRRGLYSTLKHRFYSFLGSYRRYEAVNWKKVDRLIFVCKGNICRSAFAEAVAKELGVPAISCGLDTDSNKPAYKGSVRAAKIFGVDLTQHKTTKIDQVELRKNDLIVAMEPWHIKSIDKIYDFTAQCTLMGLWANPKLPHIQDPYGKSDEYFNKCFNYIRNSVNEIFRNFEEK